MSNAAKCVALSVTLSSGIPFLAHQMLIAIISQVRFVHMTETYSHFEHSLLLSNIYTSRKLSVLTKHKNSLPKLIYTWFGTRRLKPTGVQSTNTLPFLLRGRETVVCINLTCSLTSIKISNPREKVIISSVDFFKFSLNDFISSMRHRNC